MAEVLPTLIVISGFAGSGKTTLAHRLAAAVGCPAICRDEIKEGMVHGRPGFVPGPGDELTARTLPVFFEVLELLVRAGVSLVAEAAFQDRVWRRGLEPLDGLAHLRVVQCVVDPEVARRRRLRRLAENPLRRAHADLALGDAPFDRLSIDAPQLEVDTADGYRPALEHILAWVRGGVVS